MTPGFVILIAIWVLLPAYHAAGLQQAIQNLRTRAEEAAAERMEEEPQKGTALTNLVSRGIEAVQARTAAPPSAPSDSRSFNLGGMLKKIGKLREVCSLSI